MDDQKRTFGVGALLLAIGLVAVLASLQIPWVPADGRGAQFFPLLSAVSLVLLGGLHLFGALKRPLPSQSDSAAERSYTPFVFLALVMGYIWLIGKFGYLLSTGLVAPIALFVFGVRNRIGLLAAAILCPAIYHILFFEVLGVFPPYGEWFDLLDVIGG